MTEAGTTGGAVQGAARNNQEGAMEVFEMTEEEFKRIMEAGCLVPYMVFGGIAPRSPQENANSAWRALGAKRGFDWETVKPCPEKGPMFFLAEPTKPPKAEG